MKQNEVMEPVHEDVVQENQTVQEKVNTQKGEKHLKERSDLPRSVGKRMDFRQGSEKLSGHDRLRNVLLYLVGYLLAGINVCSCNPAGIGYFAALNVNKGREILSVTVLLLGMFGKFQRIVVFKNAVILIAIVIVFRVLSIGKLRISEVAAALIAGVLTAVMELSDYAMTHSMKELNTVQGISLMLIVVFAVLTGLLCMIFHKPVSALLSQKHVFSNDEMFGFAVAAGMVLYSMGRNLSVPFAGIEIAAFLMILFSSYKYGIGMGALLGLSTAVPVCLWSGELNYLGMLCMIGILTGVFRELGRLVSVMAMLIPGVMCCYAIQSENLLHPMGVDLQNDMVKGMLGAAVIFLMLPGRLISRYDDGNADTEEDGIRHMYEERLQNVAKTFEYLSRTLFGADRGEKEGGLYEISSGTQPAEILKNGQMSEAIWQNRLKESRVMMSEQLEQISKIIEDYSKKVYDFVPISEEQEDYIRHRLKSKKVMMSRIVGLSGGRNKKEYLVTAKCSRGETVGSREIAGILSEAMGKRYIPSKNCRKLISTEYTTTTYVEEANFYVVHAAAKKARGENGISGDNYSLRELDNGHLLMGLSDGMGCGTSACLESETVIELLEQLLDNGFDAECSLKMINSVMVMNAREDHPATLDYGVIDLHSGICDMVKIGAAATFVKRGNWVETLKSTSMPLGIFANVDYDSASKKLYHGDMIIMVSDGVIDAMNCENRDERLGEIISTIQYDNPKEMAEAILNRAVADKTKLADDMTVLVTEIWENKRAA